ncbi:hypothetical protein BDV96DRAFT_202495 [Lophiotrema nucula]|uniref:Uncharacterized protein n=1 Tax=Lophiotrema nucula TaxID=690887 RepID=A0A6A5YTK9_9PLEO|nr:hypothetical protein BDV96DRAFT_202495 [Lophiotrema nucula]
MATYSGTVVPRDGHDHNLADTLYGLLPSRALDMSSADIRADAVSTKRFHDAKSAAASKRKGTSDVDDSLRIGSLLRHQTGIKRSRLPSQKQAQMELHQSTCLNLSNIDNNESDLWILPDFDEWELPDAEASQNASTKRNSDWAPLLERAANSNRERLRRRLEGDGWDFVGGKYGEEGQGTRIYVAQKSFTRKNRYTWRGFGVQKSGVY